MKNSDLKFTTARDYMEDTKSLEEHIRVTKSDPYEVDKPTGGETWQTKANEKNKVPRYMSPAELAHMRLDKLEQSLLRGMVEQRKRIDTLEDMVKNLNKRLSNISSEHLTPVTITQYKTDY